jgi:hypothetical protein
VEPLQIDGFHIRLDYSTSTLEDWKCDKVEIHSVECGCFNYERRAECFQCGSLRPSAETLADSSSASVSAVQIINDGSFDISPFFTFFLLLRGLDILSSEKTIFGAVVPFGPKRIFLMKKDGRSLGFAFAEFADLTVY